MATTPALDVRIQWDTDIDVIKDWIAQERMAIIESGGTVIDIDFHVTTSGEQMPPPIGVPYRPENLPIAPLFVAIIKFMPGSEEGESND